MSLYKQSESTAARRRVYLHLVDATDGITPETGEAGGQPQISTNGGAFGNTSATLTAIGNGLYYVELTAGELGTLGFIVVRFKSANTAEFQTLGQVVAYDPYQADLGLNNLSAADVNAEVDTALSDIDLDHFIQVTAGSEEPTDGSYLDQIMHKNGNQTFNASTDSLEAIRDTLSSSTVTVVSSVDGGTITVVPYTTWEFTIDGLADLTSALANGVFFTVKDDEKDDESAAILQVQEGVGLTILNGSSDVTAAKATLTVAGTEDEITVHVNASQTGLDERRGLHWDIKAIFEADEDADQMATGDFHISDEAVTRTRSTS